MNQHELQRIHFYKMTGAGNDFVVIDNRQGLVNADNCGEFVRYACRRKLSVGADGVILIENDPEVDFKWRFFNADASEAEMCGNGARCAARFASLTGIVRDTRMAFRTLAGIIKAELLGNRVKVQMTDPHSLRLDLNFEADGKSFQLDFINTGVPHCICFVTDAEELESIDTKRYGRALRFHEGFQPAGANVNFVHVQDSHHMIVRTYERGVEDETLACGTGCIASSLVAATRGRVVSPVEVKTRGGEILRVYFNMPGGEQNPAGTQFREVYLEGEARIAYEADLWTETLQQ
jgi:diaminopimelate epimerase